MYLCKKKWLIKIIKLHTNTKGKSQGICLFCMYSTCMIIIISACWTLSAFDRRHAVGFVVWCSLFQIFLQIPVNNIQPCSKFVSFMKHDIQASREDVLYLYMARVPNASPKCLTLLFESTMNENTKHSFVKTFVTLEQNLCIYYHRLSITFCLI